MVKFISLYKKMNNIPVYLIYLPNYQHRWESTLQNLTENGITPILFHGIDAISWRLKTDLFENKYPKKFTSGRLGCFLSHFMLWNHLSHVSNSEEAIVFEDDVRIDSTFTKSLNSILNQLPSDWDFVYLGALWGDSQSESRFSSNLLIGKPYCTHAYMVKKKALSVLMEKCYTIDCYLDIQIKEKVLPKINHFVADPFIVSQESLGNSEEYRSLCKD